MARPIKESLSYFPLDVDVFDDPKLLFVADRFDVKGEIISIKLLCWIYRNGYYCKWDDEHALIFAKKNFSNIKASLCQDVVSELLKRGFFNEDIFESFGVLTSKAIQSRWQNVIDRSKRKAEITPELNLLVQEETPPKTELTIPETDESTQSKRKESKVKESTKARDRIKKILNDFGQPAFTKELFVVDGFSEAYLNYSVYLKDTTSQWPNEYSVMEDYQTLLELKKAGNNPVKVIRQTIQARNKSFYALKKGFEKTETQYQYLTTKL